MSQTVIDLKALGKTALQIKQEGYVLSQINNIDVLFYFRDTFGDGWNNGSITIKNKSTGSTVITLTGPVLNTENWGYTNGLMNIVSAYETTKVGGDWPYEILYAITLNNQTQFNNTTTKIISNTSNIFLGETINALANFSFPSNLYYSLSELKAAGYSDIELKAGGYSVADFKAAGYTIPQLKAINFTDTELKSVGYLFSDFKAAGFTDAQLKALGFTIADFKAAGFTDAQLKALGFTIADFKAAGYTILQLKAINFTDAEIKATGYLIADFRAAGYTILQLKAINFTDTELKAGGYLFSEFKAAGFTDAQLKALGFTIAEFKAAGFTDAQLKAIGFTDGEIKFAYIITETTEQLTFDNSKAINLLINQDENTGTINVTNKNYKYFNLVNNSYDAYSSLYIRSNGWLSFYNAAESNFGQDKQQPTKSLRFFSFDAASTIKYYFDNNNNLMISTVGGFWNQINNTSFNIIIKIEPNGKITVNYKSIGIGTYKPIIGWVGTNSSLTTDDIFYSTFDGIQAFNQNNINGKTLVFNFTNSNTLPLSNICFVENSLVSTDQGLIEIQNIDENIHTINNNKIICLTKTVTEEPYLICIEKDALEENIPSQDTLISYNHKIFYNNNMISASELLDKNNKIKTVRYTGETLYNILMEKYEEFEVNGLTCETLHPQNRVAHLYLLLKEQPKEYHHYIIHNYNARFSTIKQM
jgi:hypothetical protein